MLQLYAMIRTKDFQAVILRWYRKHGRHALPWRRTRDPYKILVSEIMLQQTQVERVVPFYKRFLARFPTAKTLARAKTSEVLSLWQGLGYNRRALYLKRAAEKIVSEFYGKVPRDLVSLESLPGVGSYTARAVRVFAWNEPEIFIETNIRRVYIHFFFPRRKKVSDAELRRVIAEALYTKNPRAWYWALMDYGAGALKKIPNPNKKSKYYVRQTRFEGSRRYARAKLLAFLLGRKMASDRMLADFFKKDQSLKKYHSIEIAQLLEKEGFIEKRKEYWTVMK